MNKIKVYLQQKNYKHKFLKVFKISEEEDYILMFHGTIMQFTKSEYLQWHTFNWINWLFDQVYRDFKKSSP